ncbi:hypothetical protein QF035_002556 [Streptomyces umbrinus]|uniref:Uncharacterized protein n=1 Tax=Streptomyces umbrinus TaxID=67370 RepID=A0ABU0SN37_9ACTN|nr:hypothetical protein [Streptomyces umbrinus]MDQ1024974.1 hypothetical protein [Streptomyces umbrinus]
MKSMSRTTVLAAGAAAVVAVLSVTGAAPAQAAPAEPLVNTGDIGVRTGDVDAMEDILEHISVPFGGSGTLTHQLYDSRGADAG